MNCNIQLLVLSNFYRNKNPYLFEMIIFTI